MPTQPVPLDTGAAGINNTTMTAINHRIRPFGTIRTFVSNNNEMQLAISINHLSQLANALAFPLEYKYTNGAYIQVFNAPLK